MAVYTVGIEIEGESGSNKFISLKHLISKIYLTIFFKKNYIMAIMCHFIYIF